MTVMRIIYSANFHKMYCVVAMVVKFSKKVFIPYFLHHIFKWQCVAMICCEEIRWLKYNLHWFSILPVLPLNTDDQTGC